MLIKHEFPADAYYVFQVFPVNKGNMGGSGAFGEVTGEQLEVIVDGERVHLFDWDEELSRHGRARGRQHRVDPRQGGPAHRRRHVPRHQLRARQRPERASSCASTIQTGDLPGMTFYPHVGRVRIEGPYDAKGADDTPSRRKIFVCRPTSAEGRRAVRAADCDDAGQARVPASADARRTSGR